jgi:hypothetical protein
MRPIVDGLRAEYEDRVTFVYLNAADGGMGQAIFERLRLPGHPSYVIYRPGGGEVYRAFGVLAEEILRAEIEAVLAAEPSRSA